MNKEHNGIVVASAQGTGFLWNHEDYLFLITNLHNLSGWDYIRNKAMSGLGFLPDSVVMTLALGHPEIGGQPAYLTRNQIRAPLYLNEEPRWLIHPIHGTAVDVAALPLGTIDPTVLWPNDPGAKDLSLVTLPANRISIWTSFDTDAGDDAYVLGFPKGMDGGQGFPLWKRASIASEPAANIDSLPKALVDTATRQGMSGSPVVVVKRGLINPPEANHAGSGDIRIGQAANFFGVYSGRVDDDPLGAQIGIVWKASVVDEIVRGAARGRRAWDK